ncbi:serine hydrolase domain-containing protein [Clostridium sp. chh4-2]|uniref:serine hydrolase domain-containing protein n=1 Tax=Clostridium sp. chh4-2 TaxID=2067550 RepID=UPI0015E16A06|nr:serine hydrolase domain-containing protein [Clostridium sp. chh4-2]
MLYQFKAPETFGIESQSILNFLDACEKEEVEIHSLELRRWDEKFVAGTFAPFTERSMHRMYSSGKALCSLAFLFAMQDGLIGLDEPLVSVFADRVPEDLPEHMDQVTMYHVLTMSTGHDKDVFSTIKGSDDWVKAFMRIPLTYRPGSTYVYNNGTPHMVSEAVRLRTGKDLKTYLEEKLLSHMGETMDIRLTTQGEPDPSTISITIEAFGKLADFLYHHGSYQGKQLLRPDLADMMGQCHIPTPADSRVPAEYVEKACNGYGFHTRRNAIGGYKLSGGRSQKSLVLPEFEMTASIMANEPREGILMHLFYTHVMFQVYQRPLPEKPEVCARLKDRLEHLNLGPRGETSSPMEEKVQGRDYRLSCNEDGKKRVRFEFSDSQAAVCMDDRKIVIGKNGEWLENEPYFLKKPSDFRLNAIPGSKANLYTGAWTKENEFTFYIRSESRMATDKVCCRFDGDCVEIRVMIDPQKNAGVRIDPVLLNGFC